jgi:endonuclease/exonuclease/phosphatase family metal-dependent hydrolase
MMPPGPTVRVVTYNIHKCRGMDGRSDPERIAAVLRALDADVVALQEVVGPGGSLDHAAHIAALLGLHSSLGENRRLRGSAYGNVVLSRAVPRLVANYDITVRGREPRGCLRVDLAVAGRLLHIFNVHLGTAYAERREQARILLGSRILGHAALAGSRLLLGDFNEWVRGPATRSLGAELQSADVKLHLGSRRTYPGLFRLLHLDHIYYDPGLRLLGMELHRGRAARLASDHLPLVADFAL